MGRLGKVGGSVDASRKTDMMIDKMIPDNTVQKERAIINAGGLSPNMASFLMKDAQKIIDTKPAWKPSTIDYNFPEVHYPLDRGKKMIIKDLGAAPPLFEHINRL
jgi:hypothetical protein